MPAAAQIGNSAKIRILSSSPAMPRGARAFASSLPRTRSTSSISTIETRDPSSRAASAARTSASRLERSVRTRISWRRVARADELIGASSRTFTSPKVRKTVTIESATPRSPLPMDAIRWASTPCVSSRSISSRSRRETTSTASSGDDPTTAALAIWPSRSITRGAGRPAAIAISSTTLTSCRSSRSVRTGSRAPNPMTSPPTPAPEKRRRSISQKASMTRTPGTRRDTTPIPAWNSSTPGIGPLSLASTASNRRPIVQATNRNASGTLAGSSPTRLIALAIRMMTRNTSGVTTSESGKPARMTTSVDVAISCHVARR